MRPEAVERARLRVRLDDGLDLMGEVRALGGVG
jgi:hypothetical protein